MVYTCTLAKDICCVVFYFDIIYTTIRDAILSALYFLSLLLTASYISRFLSLFMVNIADTCVALTAMPDTLLFFLISYKLHSIYIVIGMCFVDRNYRIHPSPSIDKSIAW